MSSQVGYPAFTVKNTVEEVLHESGRIASATNTAGELIRVFRCDHEGDPQNLRITQGSELDAVTADNTVYVCSFDELRPIAKERFLVDIDAQIWHLSGLCVYKTQHI